MADRKRERRRESRLPMSIPVHVHGYEESGDVWVEVASVEDVSAGGVSFALEREVFVGQVLRLDLALPRTLRAYDHQEQTHRVYALVRHVTLTATGSRVGTMFFGKEPPRGFEAHPAGRFLLPWDVHGQDGGEKHATPKARQERPEPDSAQADVAAGRRRSARFDLLVNLLIQQADEWGEILKEELTVTDNLGSGGAQIRTTLELRTGDVVYVREAQGPFEARAQVCGTSRGPDGIRRLHLRFLDGRAPNHLIRKH
jgi:hypothetical protein